MSNKNKQEINFFKLPVPKITSKERDEFRIPSSVEKENKFKFLDKLISKKFITNYFKQH
tara:strand:- start:1759 stop:1935 length:177 start_codon:yes stop_codon:yes gene_type:complete